MARHRFHPSALGADRTFAGLDLRGQYTASGASTQQSRRRKAAVKAAIYHEQFGTASANDPERARPRREPNRSRARQGAGPRARGDDNRWVFDRGPMHRGRYRVWPVTGLSGSASCSRTPLAMPESEPRTRVSGHGPLSTTACRIEEVIRALTAGSHPRLCWASLGGPCMTHGLRRGPLAIPISHKDVEFVAALGVVARREHQPFPVGGKLGKGRKAAEVGDLLEVVSVQVNQE